MIPWLEILGTLKGATGIRDADKLGRSWLDLVNSLQDRLLDRLSGPVFRRIPLSMLELASGKEPGCRGFVLYMLMALPMMLIFAPFFLLYVLVLVPTLFIGMLVGLIEYFRFAMPKELQAVMDSRVD